MAGLPMSRLASCDERIVFQFGIVLILELHNALVVMNQFNSIKLKLDYLQYLLQSHTVQFLVTYYGTAEGSHYNTNIKLTITNTNYCRPASSG